MPDKLTKAERAIGLECQDVWCQPLLSGEKVEETRRYTLPEDFQGRKVWLLASSGEAGAPALGNAVKEGSPAATIVGWVVFSGVTHYTDRQTWTAAQDRHLVPDDDGSYGWQEGNSIFGWVVSDRAALQQPLPMVAASRVNRSLYLLEVSDEQLLAGQPS